MPITHEDKADLQFIEETHEYRLKGRNIPSVSAVLQDVGFVKTAYFTDEARDRGKLVHYLTAELDKGHEVEVPKEYEGYCRAWASYREEHPIVWEGIEEPTFHKLLRYAGTPDRWGYDGHILTVADIKTGSPLPWHGLQFAAYLQMIAYWEGVADPKTVNLAGVYLKPNGEYTQKHYRYIDLALVWEAALRCWKFKHG